MTAPTSICLNLLVLAILLDFASNCNKKKADANEPAAVRSWLFTNGAEVASATRKQNEHVQHPFLFADTKHWIRSTELSRRENWLDERKPCTLSESIVLGGQDDESLVVSLDAAYGPIESNVREIVLNQNGALLLEANQEPVDQSKVTIDDSFARHSGNIGECEDNAEGNYKRFYFQPHSDDLSWFNPANWHSTLIDSDEITQWVPQSHQIPCTEDVVLFASQYAALRSAFEGSEESSELSFKVNFRASQAAMLQNELTDVSISNLVVSRLNIGKYSYAQKDLEQLVTDYGGSLFEFGGNNSLLDSRNYLEGNSLQSPLVIDESSIQADSRYDLCLEEAGCLCGNEIHDKMAAICSFNEPLAYPDDYPCEDPIKATGYCDRICATSMIILMDPNRFSERFVSNLLNEMLDDQQLNTEPYSEHLFAGARRVEYAKYEITFRLIPSDKANYEQSQGKDLEFASLMKEKLENRKYSIIFSCTLFPSSSFLN